MACKDKTSSDSPARTAPTSQTTSDASGSAKTSFDADPAIVEVKSLRDRMCKCKDLTCEGEVYAARAQESDLLTSVTRDPELRRQFIAIDKEYRACMNKLTGAPPE